MKLAQMIAFLLIFSSLGFAQSGSDIIDRTINYLTNFDCTKVNCPDSYDCLEGKCIQTKTCSSDANCRCCNVNGSGSCGGQEGYTDCQVDSLNFYECEKSIGTCIPKTVSDQTPESCASDADCSSENECVEGKCLPAPTLSQSVRSGENPIAFVALSNSITELNFSLTVLVIGALMVVAGLQVRELNLIKKLA